MLRVRLEFGDQLRLKKVAGRLFGQPILPNSDGLCRVGRDSPALKPTAGGPLGRGGGRGGLGRSGVRGWGQGWICCLTPSGKFDGRVSKGLAGVFYPVSYPKLGLGVSGGDLD